MSLKTEVLNRVETKLPKVINAHTHGVFDYCHAAFFFAMAIMWRKKERRAAWAAAAAGSFILAESLLTDYPLGASRVIPPEMHGRMDAAAATLSFIIPKVFGFEDTDAAKAFNMSGLVAGTLTGMTNFESQADRVLEGNPIALAS